MQAWTDRAPRQKYGPRALLPETYGSRPETRKYGKGRDVDRGPEALPREAAVLCPNRIRERRTAAGFDNTMQFARHLDSISYQRLIRIETGRVIVRESELEIIADALEMDVEDLRLPPLTRAETAEWNRRWGPDTRIEEGGDHDSVILAAYVRHLVGGTGRARTALLRELGAPGNALCAIWYAEKPIDRYPDSTMAIVIRLAKAESWDAVVLRSRQLYDERAIAREVADVQKPRIRYAPEDPDRKAPWTYEKDPFRTRRPRREAETLFSAVPRVGTAKERRAAEREDQRRERIRAREERRSLMRRTFAAVIDEARHGNVRALLHGLYPNEPEAEVETLARNEDVARTVVARAALIRFADDALKRQEACVALGITRERLRQLQIGDTGRVTYFVPSRTTQMKRIVQ